MLVPLGELMSSGTLRSIAGSSDKDIEDGMKSDIAVPEGDRVGLLDLLLVLELLLDLDLRILSG